MSTDSLETKIRLSHKASEIFFGVDIIAVSSTAKACSTRAAFGNFWGFKCFAYWFTTCYGTRWRETIDSLLYQVSLLCILLQCYLFNSCHLMIQLISKRKSSSLLRLFILVASLWSEEQSKISPSMPKVSLKRSRILPSSRKWESFIHPVPGRDKALDGTAQRPTDHLTMTHSVNHEQLQLQCQ